MKIFGHPVHVMLIHFPSALFPMDLACSFLAVYTGNSSFNDSAFYAASIGVMAGWLALITGAIDLLGVAKHKPRSLNKALLHGTINSTVLIGYTLLVFLSYKHYPELGNDSALTVSIKTTLILLLFLGNYFGGSLILKDGVGLEENRDRQPKKKRQQEMKN